VSPRASARTLAVAVQNVVGAVQVPTRAKLRKWAQAAVAGTGREGELTIRIVAAAESAALNSRYRGKGGPTNVLSFPSDAPQLAGAPELLPIGDLVICADVVAREAAEQGKPLEAHWAHMVVHGTLHLLGYDHEAQSDAETMEEHERNLLKQLGFADPWLASRPAGLQDTKQFDV
jgi:probable rRNA maturation factor